MDKLSIVKHFEELSYGYDKWLNRNKFYHSCIKSLYASIIPESSSVFEIGCATGELLNYLKPSFGLGIDISENMVQIARNKYPHLTFKCADIDNLPANELNFKFDYIILSNLIDYLPDISATLFKITDFLSDDGMVIITTENPLWRPLMKLANKLRLRMPDVQRNYVTNLDVANIVCLAGLEVVRMGLKFFMPIKIPVLSSLVNFLFSEIPVLRNLCLLQYIIIRYPKKRERLSCSVIIPCYNEADNILECITRVPPMGNFTEIIVVDDGSMDTTKEILEEIIKSKPNVKLISYPQNKGKGFAVKAGCDVAIGELIMILDADMSVRPEDLPKFFEPIQNGKADFVNGSRMIYPMAGQAMRTLNYIGNKFFNCLLSWLMEQRISDTLCGTKAFLKKDYQRISMGRCLWGDYDLLFGIARLKKKILEVPIHYQARVAGKSKMRIFKHGFMLAKMCLIGFFELKLFKKN